ncbi:ACP phosphodiesterase [Chitinophagaceae bacterium LB-8]|uniref:ACP phosphodiesterase n=1 Tax=Paraflavisolibacter caeni TaxID=2982496 RepID=A0A9X3B952_9BACT|nr:ACP phosphodiesterase [Paraflavisolibacter caeni]MCU7551660.1 ACP phosphodiesterase [Paraflavisolibacter caeni]
MNFLAHAYLSFRQKEILAGNMMSDFVKGNAQYDFPESIRKGIILHRKIDEFTDTHVVTQRAKEVFRPHYRLYSAPIVDIIYDHYLANDTQIFPGNTLYQFTQTTYDTLEEFAVYMPLRFAQMFAYMKSENWLWNYRKTGGIEKSLRGLIRRSTFVSDSETACRLFLENYNELQLCYDAFFSDVKLFTKQQLDILNA